MSFFTEKTLTLPFSTPGLSLHTMSSAPYAELHQVTWPILPCLRILKNSTSFDAPKANASVTTTVAPSRGACTAVSTAAAVTSAWGTPPSWQTARLWCPPSYHRWWLTSSRHVSLTTTHQQVGGASWWWSTATRRTAQRDTGGRRMIWWWMMAQLLATTTSTTILCTMDL